MGEFTTPSLVKVIIGVLYSNPDPWLEAREALKSILGPEEEVMKPLPFTWSPYYAKELGPDYFRTFISYEKLQPRECMVWLKRLTNFIEDSLAVESKRTFNLDPGYVTLGQFFLATTKDQRQRIYLGDSIFVEPTLYFKDGSFHAFDWTYPDYRSETYQAYLKSARGKLAFQQRKGYPYSQRKAQKA